MFLVTFWNGKKIVKIFLESLVNLDAVLSIDGYVRDENHFIKIKWYPVSLNN